MSQPIWRRVMSAKRCKKSYSESSWKIRQAMKEHAKRTMPQKIEIMVEAGVMTREQADRAIRKLAEEEARAIVGEGVAAGEAPHPQVIDHGATARGLTPRDGFGRHETTAAGGHTPRFSTEYAMLPA